MDHKRIEMPFPNRTKCQECDKNFSTVGNLRKHVAKFHKELLGTLKIYKCSENYKFTCYCGKNFTHKRHYLYHQRLHKGIRVKAQSVDKSKQCPLCDYSNSFKKNLVSHFSSIHQISIKESALEFPSRDEFEMWKDEIQKTTNSLYVKRNTQTSSRTTIIVYICNRSGNFNPKTECRVRHLKAQGSNKINGYCPASIKVSIREEGKCVVNFLETHVGHTNDLGHLFLSYSERKDIAKKIAANVPFDEILDEVQNTLTDSTLHRVHLLTKKDLHNIKNEFQLYPGHEELNEDTVNATDWIDEINKDGEDRCILFYKPQDTILDNYPDLQPDDFMLIIMNDAQRDILKELGQDCVCINVTRNMDVYNFELITILVLDGTGQAFPSAFWLTNRTDEEALEIFFSHVRECAGKICPAIFMSDLSEVFYYTWMQIMEMPEHRLFCTWDVDRAWREDLLKISNKEKQVIVYNNLQTILTEKNKAVFHGLIDEFCSALISDQETSEFGNYFVDNYVESYTAWARCYRPCTGLCTDTHLTRMHRALEHVSLNDKNPMPLDKFVYALMRFVKNELIDRLVTMHKSKVISKLRDIQARHNKSKNLNMTVSTTEEGGWEIKSPLAINPKVYHIEEVKTACDCRLICNECNVCIHRYSCSCPGSAIKWVMCKHIHLLCKYRADHEPVDVVAENNIQIEFIQCDDGSQYYDDTLNETDASESVPKIDIDEEKEKLMNDFCDILQEIKSLAEIEIVHKQIASLKAALNQDDCDVPQDSSRFSNVKL